MCDWIGDGERQVSGEGPIVWELWGTSKTLVFTVAEAGSCSSCWCHFTRPTYHAEDLPWVCTGAADGDELRG